MAFSYLLVLSSWLDHRLHGSAQPEIGRKTPTFPASPPPGSRSARRGKGDNEGATLRGDPRQDLDRGTMPPPRRPPGNVPRSAPEPGRKRNCPCGAASRLANPCC